MSSRFTDLLHGSNQYHIAPDVNWPSEVLQFDGEQNDVIILGLANQISASDGAKTGRWAGCSRRVC